MNKPFPSQNAVNFAAVSFAIQYYREERRIAHAFKCGVLPDSDKPMPKSQVILNWVSHFAVARNFEGFGILSAEERVAAYERVHDFIWFHGPRLNNETIAERALRVESGLRDALAQKSSLLSATTKLLWLVDRESIIYDGRLRKVMGTPDGNYSAFCDKWASEFNTMASSIEAAVVGLNDVSHLFPQSWDLKHDTKRHWFMARTFDTFHWL